MKSLAIFGILLAIYFASAFNLRELANQPLQQQPSIPTLEEQNAGFHSRISNGLPAAFTWFPFMVGLEIFHHNGKHVICGGSLIHRGWVLTAAHCTDGGIKVDAHIGSPEFSVSPIVLRANRSHIIEHEDFNRETFVNDIALIEIKQLAPTTTTVLLPPRGTPDYINRETDLVGWGSTKEFSHNPSPELLYARFRIISNEECAKYYGINKINMRKICTATTRRTGGCHGDTGGPLLLAGNLTQIGIFSFFAKAGCEEDKPDAFTRVDQYLGWIHVKTRNEV